MNDTVKSDISLYFQEKAFIAQKFPVNEIANLYKSVENTYVNDGLIHILGNGGSASIVEGFCVDLRTHPFVQDKSLTTETRRLKVVSN